jgi:hypothetical protein
MSWLDRLQDRWKLDSIRQVIIVLIVFACTGFTVLFLKRPLVGYFTENGATNVWFSLTYYALILPVYNLFLLFYGFVFGQFSFFWNFEKRMWYRMTGQKNKLDQ